MRKLLLICIALLLMASGFVIGRLSAPAPMYQVGGLFGDASMEQAWEDFVYAQRYTLEQFRASPFFQDDQERAEAYLGMLYAVQDAISTHALPLAEAGARGEAPPLSPQPMALALTAAADALLVNTASWRARSRELWNSVPRNSISSARPGRGAGEFIAGGSWELNNEQAIVVEILPGAAAAQTIALTGLWHMGTVLEPLGSQLHFEKMQCGAAKRCYAVISHRDPGVANWLDTKGHRRGLVEIYWRGALGESTSQPQASAQLVAFEQLPALLAGDE